MRLKIIRMSRSGCLVTMYQSLRSVVHSDCFSDWGQPPERFLFILLIACKQKRCNINDDNQH